MTTHTGTVYPDTYDGLLALGVEIRDRVDSLVDSNRDGGYHDADLIDVSAKLWNAVREAERVKPLVGSMFTSSREAVAAARDWLSRAIEDGTDSLAAYGEEEIPVLDTRDYEHDTY